MAPPARKRAWRQMAVARGGRFPKRRRVGALIKRALAGELKFVDTTVGLTASAVAGVVLSSSLNVIPEGNGESQRVGRKITIKRLGIRGSWENQLATTASNMDNRLRIVVYQDKQTNGAAATVTGILETATIDSFRNLANQGRFRILFDKTIAVRNTETVNTNTTTFTSVIETRSWSFFKALNIPIEYDNSLTTGVISTQRTNNIGIIILSATDAAPPQVAFTARVRYSDN